MTAKEIIELVTNVGVPFVLLAALIWRGIPALTVFVQSIIAEQKAMTAAIRDGFTKLDDKIESSQRELEKAIRGEVVPIEEGRRSGPVSRGRAEHVGR